MMGVVALIILAREYLAVGLVALIALIVAIEAGFRRRLRQFITSVTIALAVLATLIVLYEFFWSVVVIAVLLAGGYLMADNLRELWR